jgi:hypothetical protein
LFRSSIAENIFRINNVHARRLSDSCYLGAVGPKSRYLSLSLSWFVLFVVANITVKSRRPINGIDMNEISRKSKPLILIKSINSLSFFDRETPYLTPYHCTLPLSKSCYLISGSQFTLPLSLLVRSIYSCKRHGEVPYKWYINE